MNPQRTLLLIEDMKTIQLYIKQLVTPINYEVHNKTNLLDVKAFIQENKIIDVAIVSMDLYSKDLEEIIDVLLVNNVSVILLSGLEDIELRQRFLLKPIIDYIDKDILSNFKEIAKILQRLDANKQQTILVVDDSKLYRRLISDILKRHKFNVLEAEDGLEAVETLKKNKQINSIVTDYEMPNLDGLGLIKSVRKEYSLNELPIIVISSLDSSSTIVDCLKNGANDFLHKPFSNHEFYSRLYLTLSHKENLDIVQEQKNIYATLFHESSNGILLMKDAKFIDCNEAALKFLQFSTKEQLLNKTPEDFSPSNHTKDEQNEDDVHRCEWQYIRSDGTLIWIDVLQTPLVIDGEDVTHVVWHDITHMKELESDLETLNASLEKRVAEEVRKNASQTAHMLEQSRLAQMGEMISMIAHQWRQPLASISAISSTLNLDVMMDNYDSDFFSKRLESIDQLSQHLSLTIDDFRGFFKNNKESGLTTITNIVEGTLAIIQPTFETKGIKVLMDINTNEEFSTYLNELKQVVLNLLKNAEDALMDKESLDKFISIKGYTDDEYIYILLEDNAGGIPEDIMEKIFDPYFSTKKEKDGTGLGLYMSKTIIQEHCKGSLKVENSDQGARFTIMLPKSMVEM